MVRVELIIWLTNHTSEASGKSEKIIFPSRLNIGDRLDVESFLPEDFDTISEEEMHDISQHSFQVVETHWNKDETGIFMQAYLDLV